MNSLPFPMPLTQWHVICSTSGFRILPEAWQYATVSHLLIGLYDAKMDLQPV